MKDVRNWLDTERSHKELFTREEVNDKRAKFAETIRHLAVQQAQVDLEFPVLNFVPEGLRMNTKIAQENNADIDPPSKKRRF